MKPLDALDSLQLMKGLFALALLIAWVLNPEDSVSVEQVQKVSIALALPRHAWSVFMAFYVLAAFSCLFWKERRFQFSVSLISLWWWTTIGCITMLSPQAAAAGVYEVELGLVSLTAMYYRGRQ